MWSDRNDDKLDFTEVGCTYESRDSAILRLAFVLSPVRIVVARMWLKVQCAKLSSL